jgi:hypothetical protein
MPLGPALPALSCLVALTPNPFASRDPAMTNTGSVVAIYYATPGMGDIHPVYQRREPGAPVPGMRRVRKGGMGPGLIERLVGRMGGSLERGETPGGGTQYRVRFPVVGA